MDLKRILNTMKMMTHLVVYDPWTNEKIRYAKEDED
jgi:hypothetical protein